MSPALDALRPLVEIMAAERTKERPDLFDEAVQEGMIRAWIVKGEKPDAPAAYVHAAARRAVGDVVRGRPAFGAPSHRGREEPLDSVAPLIREDADGDVFETDPADMGAEDAFDAVLIEGAIHAAVAALPDGDREVVFLRYWKDLGFQEIAGIVGRPAGTISRRWTDVSRPALRERLAPLASAA